MEVDHEPDIWDISTQKDKFLINTSLLIHRLCEIYPHQYSLSYFYWEPSWTIELIGFRVIDDPQARWKDHLKLGCTAWIAYESNNTIKDITLPISYHISSHSHLMNWPDQASESGYILKYLKGVRIHHGAFTRFE